MSERLRNAALVALILVMGAVLVVLVVTAPSEADRVERIGSQIKCPVCQGESIANSPADMARDMMAFVEERVAAGVSDDEIVDELLGSYTGAVLLDPPASGSTLFLWLAPLLALALGVGVITWWRKHPTGEPPPSEGRDKRRLMAGGIILGGALVGIVAIAVLSLQEDDAGPASGVASLDVESLGDVSNETMEAVVAANLDNPQINGMRLALAERYFEANDYRSAFPHYLAVAESAEATQAETGTALVRLGWMAWDGNAETETALSLFDQALAVDPASTTARFMKARVLWCGADDPETAREILADLAQSPGLSDESRALVERDLEAIRSGEECS